MLKIKAKVHNSQGVFFITPIAHISENKREFSVLYYVDNKTGVINMLMVYRSRSQAVWRTTNIATLNYLFKEGHPEGELAQLLPPNVQKALMREGLIPRHEFKESIFREAYAYLTTDAILEGLKPNESMVLSGEKIIDLKDPENLPDVRSPHARISEWKGQDPIYGECTYVILKSRNAEYKWLIVVPKNEKYSAFVGGIFASEGRTKYGLPITPIIIPPKGVPKYVINMPPMDYPHQVERILKGYVSEKDLIGKGCISSYCNFSNIIQKWNPLWKQLLGPVKQRIYGER